MSRPLSVKVPEIRYPPATFAVDVPLRERLNRRARELNRSASWVVRAALDAYLSRPADKRDRYTLTLEPLEAARRNARSDRAQRRP